MKHTFIICGYPRSRTMWLSRFLTLDGISYCTHEATEFAGSQEQFWSNAEKYAQQCDYYGNSDSANIFVLPALLAEADDQGYLGRPPHGSGHQVDAGRQDA